MKRSFVFSAGACALGLGLPLAASAVPIIDIPCSNSSLLGTYVYTIMGMDNTQDISQGVFREAGMESFDGAGRVVNLYTTSRAVSEESTGVYEIAPNCEGTVTYEDGNGRQTVYKVYVDPKGNSFTFLDTTPGNIKAGGEQRVSLQPILMMEGGEYCSKATLSGTYVYHLSGYDTEVPDGKGSYAEIGIESYDGQGNAIFRATDSNGETSVTRGTYDIGPNCVGSLVYQDWPGESRMYVAPRGNAYVFVDYTGTMRDTGESKRVSPQILVSD